MTVIGYQLSPELRERNWKDMLEMKKSFLFFKNSSAEQERTIAEIDRELYANRLQQYVN